MAICKYFGWRSVYKCEAALCFYEAINSRLSGPDEWQRKDYEFECSMGMVMDLVDPVPEEDPIIDYEAIEEIPRFEIDKHCPPSERLESAAKYMGNVLSETEIKQVIYAAHNIIFPYSEGHTIEFIDDELDWLEQKSKMVRMNGDEYQERRSLLFGVWRTLGIEKSQGYKAVTEMHRIYGC